MATEDDNFDIDIYGDGGGYNANEQGDFKQEDSDFILDAPEHTQNGTAHGESSEEQKPETEQGQSANGEHVTNTHQAHGSQTHGPPIHQGVKRKEHDDRPSDPDAMTALLISDLYWWTTDDDIRGWVRDAECEDELKEVTFSEHKVNGKSKGSVFLVQHRLAILINHSQVFLEFTSLQAATATKHRIEGVSESGQTGRRHMVTYTSPFPNPFRTLPKDAPMRKENQARAASAGFNSPTQNMNFGMNNMGSGFRGGRGGFNNRGGMNNMGFGGNRPFPNPMGGFQGAPMMPGFQAGPMGGMQNFGFNNRGNMMGGMRGGPGGMRGRGGGMATPNMMGMPAMGPMGGMGGMGMNPMAGGMNPMMGGMGGMSGNMAMPGTFNVRS